jgi:putative transposase
MRDRYKIYENEGIHFVTSTIIEWIPVFTSESYFNIIIDSLKYCMQNKNFCLYNYVILDNHFHMIVSASDLSGTLASIRKYTASQIVKQLTEDKNTWLLNLMSFYKKKHKIKSQYQVWQEGVHPELIQSDTIYRQKAEYIHNNPLERGYVSRQEHWLYSSARNYILGDDSLIKVNKELV